MKKDSIVYPVVFMTGLAIILTFVLAILNESTAAQVEYNENLDLQRKVLYVFDLYDDRTTDEEVTRIFDERIEESLDSQDRPIYTLVDESNNPQAYAASFEGPGLWGSIRGIIGISADMNTITGIEFIEQNETPGLGGRIGEPPYKEQYRGVEIDPADSTYIISRPATGGNIDAVSGATQTSDYVENMVNEGLDEFFEEAGVN